MSGIKLLSCAAIMFGVYGCGTPGANASVHTAVHSRLCIGRVYVLVARFQDEFSQAAFDSVREGLSKEGVAVAGRALTGLELEEQLEAEMNAHRAGLILYVRVKSVVGKNVLHRYHVRAELRRPGSDELMWEGFLHDDGLSQTGMGTWVGNAITHALVHDGFLGVRCSRPDTARSAI